MRMVVAIVQHRRASDNRCQQTRTKMLLAVMSTSHACLVSPTPTPTPTPTPSQDRHEQTHTHTHTHTDTHTESRQTSIGRAMFVGWLTTAAMVDRSTLVLTAACAGGCEGARQEQPSERCAHGGGGCCLSSTLVTHAAQNMRRVANTLRALLGGTHLLHSFVLIAHCSRRDGAVPHATTSSIHHHPAIGASTTHHPRLGQAVRLVVQCVCSPTHYHHLPAHPHSITSYHLTPHARGAAVIQSKKTHHGFACHGCAAEWERVVGQRVWSRTRPSVSCTSEHKPTEITLPDGVAPHTHTHTLQSALTTTSPCARTRTRS
jgi:hypothetical protein